MRIKNIKYDVAVMGGGPSGLAAGLAAARHGAKVIIVERNGYLGGNAASGLPLLGFLDKSGNQVVAGIAQEFIDRLIEIGGSFGHNRCPLHNSVTIVHPDLFKVVAFEKCQAAGIDILLHCEVIDVDVENRKISRVTVMGKGTRITVEANVFIDSTGDGDVSYLAGAEYQKGQSDTGVMQPPTVMFALSNFNQERFYAYLEEHPEDLIPAESMQVSLGYDTAYFKSHPSHVFLGLRSLLDKLKEQGIKPLKRDTLIYINSMNPGQIYINATRILNFDGTDVEDLTRGEIEGHFQIVKLVKVLREYVPGFENCTISNINPMIGVRETRRFAGVKTLTIDKVIEGDIPEDTIALGAYKVDIHSGTNETTILTDLEKPYGIPMGCLISKNIEGLLLSGRCISMDAQTLATARIIPTCMAIGEAAGVCAALAVKSGKLPSEIASEEIREILKTEGALVQA